MQPLFTCASCWPSPKGAEESAADVHDAWTAWMVPHDRGHSATKPFDELDVKTPAVAAPFVEAIRAATEHRDGSPI
jgi:hypothetical protein